MAELEAKISLKARTGHNLEVPRAGMVTVAFTSILKGFGSYKFNYTIM